ncbi:unnamed protein product [Ambrosiozyma monospora]|uniref:Unnamed protein product n=1 Tax=Ambrosiozyma monospora TaxID=43982 RepID=A0A9W6YUB9_AMBMO|nr:unnamed protein product [Ambrosiozyma monospora]
MLTITYLAGPTMNVTPSPSINSGINRTIPSTIHELLQQQSSSSSYNGLRQQEVVSQNTIQHQHSETVESSFLPKVHVPQGAQNTLVAAGLTEVQIEALAKLIAFHKPDILPGSDALASGKPAPLQQSSSSSYLPQSSFVGFKSSTGRNQSNTNSVETPSYTTLSAPSSGTASAPQTATTTPSVTQSRFGPTSSTTTVSSFSPVQSTSPQPYQTTSSLYSKSSPTNSDTSTKATETDKRRRNTAASARFRIKKKMKEQEMERTLKELSDMSKNMEMKIQQLEMENRLLRNLVVEKGNQRDSEELERLKKRARISVENDESEQIKKQKLQQSKRENGEAGTDSGIVTTV